MTPEELPADVLDFCAYRAVKLAKDRGTSVRELATTMHRTPLDAETRRALRRWRCFEARLTQLAAAERACVTVRAWGDAERGRPVAEAVRRRIFAAWTQSKTL